MSDRRDVRPQAQSSTDSTSDSAPHQRALAHGEVPETEEYESDRDAAEAEEVASSTDEDDLPLSMLADRAENDWCRRRNNYVDVRSTLPACQYTAIDLANLYSKPQLELEHASSVPTPFST